MTANSKYNRQKHRIEEDKDLVFQKNNENADLHKLVLNKVMNAH